jgi:hypothetical protein
VDRIGQIAYIIDSNIRQLTGLDGSFFGICEKMTVEGKTVFGMKHANKVQKGVFLDDSEKINLLHYVESISSEPDYEQGFGNNVIITDSFTLTTLVYIPNTPNTLSSKKMLQNLVYAYPSTLSRTNKQALGIRRYTFSVGSSTDSKHQIFSEEFSGQKDQLSDDAILIKISFEVSLSYDRSCMAIDCELEEVEILPQQPLVGCDEVNECITDIFGGDASVQ